ncbi:MAG: hypothetical protein Q8880_06230 [Bacteroidota bacterium]|nr:hypothetical protein [Bacteroidota bacterium]
MHVHCKYQDKESKAEIIYINGKFKEVILKEVQGKPHIMVMMLHFRKVLS